MRTFLYQARGQANAVNIVILPVKYPTATRPIHFQHHPEALNIYLQEVPFDTPKYFSVLVGSLQQVYFWVGFFCGLCF